MNNKIAIVTGSSKGIGKAIVMAFARSKEYSGIVVNARRAEEAQNVFKEIMDSYSKWCSSLAVEADVSKESDCIRLIHETRTIKVTCSELRVRDTWKCFSPQLFGQYQVLDMEHRNG